MTKCLLLMTAAVLTSLQATAQHAGHGQMKSFQVNGPRPGIIASSDIRDKSGKRIGTINLTEGNNGLLMQLRVEAGSGLAPGLHGLHFHSVGTCDGQDDFKSAGAHLGQDDAAHGLLASGHAGDLPNLGVAADGSALAEISAPMAHLKPVKAKHHHHLLDADGTALIIHADTDDHWSQPIGKAGARLACAIIRKP